MGDSVVGGGPGLAASILPRMVYLAGGVVEVRLPTVREAVCVLSLISGAVRGDEADEGQLEVLLSGWLPPEIVEWLGEQNHADRVTNLTELLNRGIPQMPAQDDDENEGDGPVSYLLLLADYVQIYGGEAWEVLDNTPWPFFIHALMMKDAASCRELLRWAQLAVLPNGGKGVTKTLEGLERRAKGLGPDTRSDGHGAYAPKEVIEKDRADLKALMSGRALT